MAEIKKEYYNQAKEKTSYRNDWWAIDEKELYMHLFPLVRYIRQKQGYRRTANIRHARLYSNMDALGAFSSTYGKVNSDGVGTHKLSLNIVSAVVDTLSSKIAKAKPRTVYLTDMGDWKRQQRAKKLQKFMEGWRQGSMEYDKKQQAFVDSGIFGTGLVKFYADPIKGEICCERVLVDEIDVDDAEAIYGQPQSLYQARFVARDKLLAAYPKMEHAILQATAGEAQELAKSQSSDLVMVIEAWHLPSDKNTPNGRHVIACDACTLYDETWEFEWFPFSKLMYKPRITGWFGMGAAECLLPIQIEINKTIRSIEAAHRLMATPRIYVENSSGINQGTLTNDIGSIIKFTGSPPIESQGVAMPSQIYAYLENLWQKGFAQEGVSMLSASSQKPAGLNSGAALREYQDVESERFQLMGQRYEMSFLESDRIVIGLTKKLNDQLPGGVKVKLGGYGGAETIKWSEVEMDEDKYIIQQFPASILPTTPAGRLQTVTELSQSGFIDKETALNLLDFPDLKATTSLLTANQQLVKKIIDSMIETEKYVPPEPYFGLQFAKDYAQLSYLKSKMDGVPDEKLELLRTFMSDCQTLLDKAAQPPPGAGPVQMQGEAIANPQAPPTSDLLPI
jgi:nucleoid DNA-binding protein